MVKRKRIGGKLYLLSDINWSKKEAEKSAKGYRKLGCRARIIKIKPSKKDKRKHKYEVYAWNKKWL